MSASLAPECNDLKEKHDNCFLKWYSEKYLRGKATTDECEGLLKEYQSCLNKALKEKGIDVMVDRARQDNAANDDYHMKR